MFTMSFQNDIFITKNYKYLLTNIEKYDRRPILRSRRFYYILKYITFMKDYKIKSFVIIIQIPNYGMFV